MLRKFHITDIDEWQKFALFVCNSKDHPCCFLDCHSRLRPSGRESENGRKPKRRSGRRRRNEKGPKSERRRGSGRRSVKGRGKRNTNIAIAPAIAHTRRPRNTRDQDR